MEKKVFQLSKFSEPKIIKSEFLVEDISIEDLK